MSTITTRHADAGRRYVAALTEFRAAFADLAAHDRAYGGPSFGEMPNPIQMRHPVYATDFGGSFTDDVHARHAQITK